MKNEITITQEQFHEAVKKTMDELIEKSKTSPNNSGIGSLVSGLFYSIFAAELLCVLFEGEDNLEIEEKN